MVAMKRILSLIFTIPLLFLTACSTVSQDAQEATVIDGGVRISLYENQALPYRWSIGFDSDILYLESTEQEDGFSFPFAAGDSPANRVFTLRFIEDGSARITLSCARIEPEDAEDTIGKRVYLMEKSGDSITLIVETAAE